MLLDLVPGDSDVAIAIQGHYHGVHEVLLGFVVPAAWHCEYVTLKNRLRDSL